MDAFSRQHLHTDTAAAALLTYTQLSVFSRVDRSVRPYTSTVPPKMNLRVYIYIVLAKYLITEGGLLQ